MEFGVFRIQNYLFPHCSLEVRYAGVTLELVKIYNSMFTLLFFVIYSTYFFSNSYVSNCYN